MWHKIHPADRERVDRLLDELTSSVFATDEMRRAWVHQLNIDRAKRWNQSGACHFPGCNKPSIPRSHSLSEKLMIDPIAEDGRVVGPKVNTFEGRYEVKSQTVKQASTFPGFCESHEQAFVFEKDGQMCDGRGLQMQLFRSVCRHMFFLKRERDDAEQYRARMRTQLKARVDDFVRNQPEMKTPRPILLSHIDGELLGGWRLRIEQRQKDIESTSRYWHEPNAQFFGEGLPPTMYGKLIKRPEMQPVVLSGPILMPNCARENDGTPDFSKTMYVNLFPNRGCTLIHLVCLRKRKRELQRLAERMEDGRFLTWCIEYWLVERCEHWYMSPKSWNGLDVQKQKEICEKLDPSGGS